MSKSHTSDRIVIVGGGISGLSIAARLAQAGLPVTVLEASQLGVGASTRNQGWLYSGGWFAREQPELAHACYESLLQTMSFCPESLEPGQEDMAYVFSKPDTSTEHWTRAWQRARIPYRDLAVSKLLKSVPGLAAAEVQHAFRLPDRAIRVDVLLKSLATAAQNAGAEIRTATAVSDLLVPHDAVQGVATRFGEEITARMVILAGNFHTVRLWPEAVQKAARDASGCRLESFKLHLAAVKPALASRSLCVVDADGFNHIPHATASVFGTSRWLPTSHGHDDQVAPVEAEQLRNYMQRFFPELAKRPQEIIEWAGTTMQAIWPQQGEPSFIGRPTVVDHAQDASQTRNLLTVFPGRATLWSYLAEETLKVVLQKLDRTERKVAAPPWGTLTEELADVVPHATREFRNVVLYHCLQCGKVTEREAAISTPVCCGAVMDRAGERTVREAPV